MKELSSLSPDMVRTIHSVLTKGFSHCTVLVVGDLMVDEHVIGRVERVSPEAPIPVMIHERHARACGGAANVVLNLLGLSASVRVVGVVGDDDAGHWLMRTLEASGADVRGIVIDARRPTTLKTRFRTDRQQILRLDREDTSELDSATQTRMLASIQDNICSVKSLCLVDYAKGVLTTSSFVSAAISIANAGGALCAVDTKTRQIERFRGVTFLKPNQTELEEATGIKARDESGIVAATRQYFARTGTRAVVLTRGGDGIVVATPGDAPVSVRTTATEVYDVTGAGDTVMAATIAAMTSGLDWTEAAVLSNMAAQVVVRKMGTVAITLHDLRTEFGEAYAAS